MQYILFPFELCLKFDFAIKKWQPSLCQTNHSASIDLLICSPGPIGCMVVKHKIKSCQRTEKNKNWEIQTISNTPLSDWQLLCDTSCCRQVSNCYQHLCIEKNPLCINLIIVFCIKSKQTQKEIWKTVTLKFIHRPIFYLLSDISTTDIRKQRIVFAWNMT